MSFTLRRKLQSLLFGPIIADIGHISMRIDELDESMDSIARGSEKLLLCESTLLDLRNSIKGMSEDIAVMRSVFLQNEAFSKAFNARRNDSDFIEKLGKALTKAAEKLNER